MNFTYADDQKWYYLKEHRPDEVTMLKIWDNSESVEAKRKLNSLTSME